MVYWSAALAPQSIIDLKQKLHIWDIFKRIRLLLTISNLLCTISLSLQKDIENRAE